MEGQMLQNDREHGDNLKNNFVSIADVNNMQSIKQSVYHKQGANQQSLLYQMPDNSVILNEIKSSAFRRSNPYDDYATVKKIGTGSVGQIFKVRRKKDDAIVVMKKIELQTTLAKEFIKNEVGLMQLCKAQDNILNCLEAYDFNDKLWIIVELMEGGALTDMILENMGKISEDVCAYIIK